MSIRFPQHSTVKIQQGSTTDYGYESRTGPQSCFASTNSWFVARSRKFVIQDSSESQNSILRFLLCCKPKWHNKANRWELVLAKVLHSVTLASLATCNRCEIDSCTFLQAVKASIHQYLLTYFWHKLVSIVCGKYSPTCCIREKKHVLLHPSLMQKAANNASLTTLSVPEQREIDHEQALIVLSVRFNHWLKRGTETEYKSGAACTQSHAQNQTRLIWSRKVRRMSVVRWIRQLRAQKMH